MVREPLSLKEQRGEVRRLNPMSVSEAFYQVPISSQVRSKTITLSRCWSTWWRTGHDSLAPTPTDDDRNRDDDTRATRPDSALPRLPRERLHRMIVLVDQSLGRPRRFQVTTQPPTKVASTSASRR